MSRIVYLNGRCVPREEAVISVDNGGWLHGAGLFETMRAENGRVFRLEDHLRRLRASAEKLLAPIDDDTLPDDAVLRDLLRQNDLTAARVRLTLTAGSMLADTEHDEKPSLTVCVTVSPLGEYPKSLYEKGISVLISKYRQGPCDPLAGHKTTNYLPRLLALRHARQAGCTEALWFTPENLLAEGSISNVFIVTKGTVATPPLDTPVLPGIARSQVLSICAEDGVESKEQPVNINDLLDADEVFVTNSIMQIMPVCRVEQRDIGEARPGPVTRGLWQQYKQRVAQECPSHG